MITREETARTVINSIPSVCNTIKVAVIGPSRVTCLVILSHRNSESRVL